MYRTLLRTSLKRSLHTPSSSASIKPNPKTRNYALGVVGVSTGVVATYVAWRTWDARALMDAGHEPGSPVLSSTASSSKLSSNEPSFDPPTSTPEPSDPLPISSDEQEPSSTPTSPNSNEQEETSDTSESSGGAFNPLTGEINWDCPCLGGMAHGPCGPEFRAAFSCFVYSEEEPKGIECVDKFKGMQDCFRRYPEDYGDEIDDDEGEGVDGVEEEVEKTGAIVLAKEEEAEVETPSKRKTQKAT